MIELDVLRPGSEFPDGGDWRRAARAAAAASARCWSPTTGATPGVVTLTFGEVLEAFTRAPLDRVEIDCDLKIAGREDEVVAALGERGLLERAMISTMEVSSLGFLRGLDPACAWAGRSPR